MGESAVLKEPLRHWFFSESSALVRASIKSERVLGSITLFRFHHLNHDFKNNSIASGLSVMSEPLK